MYGIPFIALPSGALVPGQTLPSGLIIPSPTISNPSITGTATFPDGTVGAPPIHGGTATSGIYFSGSSPAVTVASTLKTWWDPNGLIMQSGSIRYAAGPSTQTGATYTVAIGDVGVIANASGTMTLTLPAVGTFPGRQLWIRTIAAQAVVSNASNVVPQIGGPAGTAILPATDGAWALLISDGTSWQIMAAGIP